MNPFHDYLSKQLAELLTKRRVVVWYDPKEEFVPYIQELRGRPGEPFAGCMPERVKAGELGVHLCVGQGSLFEVKFAIEPVFGTTEPEPLVVYLPGVERVVLDSPLMELEKAGECRERFLLKQQARFALRAAGFGEGAIDEMLPENRRVTYEDIVAFLAEHPDDGPASILKVVFPQAAGIAELLADWLAQPGSDQAIAGKGAAGELVKLIGSRLGLELPTGIDLPEVRTKTLRYVLVSEFRDDLSGEPPMAISMIRAPSNKDDLKLARRVAEAIRERHAESYAALADQVEGDLGLATASIDPAVLGRVDTFRFEERVLLKHVGSLIRGSKYAEALEVVGERRRSFWADHDMRRQQQWEACRLMAELGALAAGIVGELPKSDQPPKEWIDRYTRDGGWYRLDLTQRHLEALLASMTEDPECEQARHVVQVDYEDVLDQMAKGFAAALKASAWVVAGVRAQSAVYAELLEGRPGPVALVLVDSMRYEMGVELRDQLSEADELQLEPAVAAIPTITPVGMAALLPGAAGAFGVTEKEGSLAAEVGGSAVATLQDRLRYLKGRVPGLVDLELGKLLDMPVKQLAGRVKNATLVLVRSQGIDEIGEGGSRLARQVMDTAIGNVARAIRRLADQGVERFVVAADHGHLFLSSRDESMRIDPPGGQAIALHRRCWIGRGGVTPAGTVRVPGPSLGYHTDLDFVMPTNLAVFRAGGDLAYHHGGISLQEMVVPVLVVRACRAKAAAMPGTKVAMTGLPATITNRTFPVSLQAAKGLFGETEVDVRPVLLHGGVQVGEAGMAMDAQLDPVSRCVRLTAGKQATVAMLLRNDDVGEVRVVVQDPKTEAVLAESDKIPVKLGM